MQLLTRIVGSIALASFLLWFAGALLSDRWAWSQWLAWIPTSVIILIFAMAGVFFFCVKKRVFATVCFGGTALLLLWFCFAEHHVHKSGEPKGAIKIIGWTMSHSKGMVAEESADLIVTLNSDITVLTHGWKVRGEKSIKEWLGDSGRKVINSQFTLLTKFTPLQVRTLVASDGIYISSFTLDTAAILGDDLVLWAVDFPSSFLESKMEIAHRVQRLLHTIETTPPDIVIGDFNMTRNSVAIETMFPELQDIASSSGIGVLASFPMEFPLFHIDHILLSNRFIPTYYELFNPHIGRHRIQIVEINRNPRLPRIPE